jgi:hypothetical protein
MKTLLLTVLFAASMMSAWSQTPAQILEEYRAKAETACQKLNGTLQTQGAAIAAGLVAKGDTAGAADISKQIEAKLKGEPVTSPHSAAATLFTQYDTARASALKPLQAASIQRIEAMLKTSAGKDMKVILELAKAREEIEGVKAPAVAPSVPASVAKMPLEWEYYAHPNMAKLGGRMVFKEDGTFILFGPPGKTSATPGTWATTANSNVLSVQINGGEKGTITMNGRTAVFERPIGTRYLKAK